MSIFKFEFLAFLALKLINHWHILPIFLALLVKNND